MYVTTTFPFLAGEEKRREAEAEAGAETQKQVYEKGSP